MFESGVRAVIHKHSDVHVQVMLRTVSSMFEFMCVVVLLYMLLCYSKLPVCAV